MKSLLSSLAVMLVMLVVSCKEDDPIPSVEGTTWNIYVKWSSAPDTVLFYTRYDGGGTGVEVDGGGTPTGVTFTWTQDDNAIEWVYAGPMTFNGTLSGDGKTMSGTAVAGPNSAGWRAVKK